MMFVHFFKGIERKRVSASKLIRYSFLSSVFSRILSKKSFEFVQKCSSLIKGLMSGMR